MRKNYCILFAGAVGSSKTPIANYLSGKLNLPIFNNDAIRTEVIEDLGEFDPSEHINRRNERLGEIFENNFSFIIDASVNSEWKNLKGIIDKFGYEYFVISLDFEKDFLKKLYKTKNYNESLQEVDKFFNEHEIFLEENGSEIDFHIKDNDFKDRLNLSFQAVNNWLNHERNKN